jgi:transposase
MEQTWDLLCRLTGRRDFLYIADCKLATTENMAHIHQRQGRFLTVLPRTRSEDRGFRDLLSQDQVQWHPIHDKRNVEPHHILHKLALRMQIPGPDRWHNRAIPDFVSMESFALVSPPA